MAKLALIVVDIQVDNEGMCREMDIVEKVVSVISACHKEGSPSVHHSTPRHRLRLIHARWQQQMLK